MYIKILHEFNIDICLNLSHVPSVEASPGQYWKSISARTFYFNIITVHNLKLHTAHIFGGFYHLTFVLWLWP